MEEKHTAPCIKGVRRETIEKWKSGGKCPKRGENGAQKGEGNPFAFS